ncbi:MAG: hypothetical protein EOP00_17415 [Pedobacter sp.]|nr:MAG: hypothetical protein EOP00_17415 [Pedobacter sp.]
MQDEITKHGKKIYKKAMSKEHSFAEKVKDILIEILIIVFAVTLSIWFHSWSENRHNENDAIGFLTDLKSDLNNDILNLRHSKKTAQNNIQIINNKQDLVNTETVFTKISNGNFEGFKTSGKIGHISNSKLRLELLNYYGDTYFATRFYDDMSNNYLQTLKIENSESTPTQKQINLQKTYIKEAQTNVIYYDKTIKETEDIIKLIDAQLAE